MLYIIGLGLGDEKDITVKGLEAVKSSDLVFLEGYTSIIGTSIEKLEAFYGKKIILADRDLVETQAETIIDPAKTKNVSFLVVGDVFGATTHTDLFLRAKEKGIAIEVIHNAGIMNAVSCCGLQLYKFGQAVSICFFTEHWRPDSWYEKIEANKKIGLHTLLLLDIKVKEQSEENLLRGRKIYEPPRFMTVSQAAKQLIEVEEKKQRGVCGKDVLCLGLARVGQPTQHIGLGTIAQLAETDFGAPLHCMVIPGEMDEIEKEFVEQFRL